MPLILGVVVLLATVENMVLMMSWQQICYVGKR
jgi:hypothetical protein